MELMWYVWAFANTLLGLASTTSSDALMMGTRRFVIAEGSLIIPLSSFRLKLEAMLLLSEIFQSLTVLSDEGNGDIKQNWELPELHKLSLLIHIVWLYINLWLSMNLQYSMHTFWSMSTASYGAFSRNKLILIGQFRKSTDSYGTDSKCCLLSSVCWKKNPLNPYRSKKFFHR